MDQTTAPKITLLRLVTVHEFAQTEPYGRVFSKASLRHMIFAAKERRDSTGKIVFKGNGLRECGAILRVGRKVLIDLDAFDDWLLAHAGAQNNAA